MRCLLAILIFLTSCFVSAQTKADSLQKAIEQMQDNEKKVDALIALSWEYEYNAPEKSIKISETAIQLAQKINYQKGMAQALNTIGNCYSIIGKNEKALANYIESLKIKEKINDVRGIGVGYVNIAIIYGDQEQYAKALDYFNKAIVQYQKINDEKEIAAAYNFMGTVYFKQEMLDSSKFFIDKAINMRTKLKDEEGLMESYANLAIIYKAYKDYRMALKYYDLIEHYNRENDNNYDQTITLNNMSLLYAELHDLDKAIELSQQSIKISEKFGYVENLKYAYGNLASFYRDKKDFSNAYHYLSVYFSVADSLKNEALSRSLNDLSIKYETEKKDQENRYLQAQNELSEKTIKQQKTIFYVILCGLALSILFIVFVIRSNRQKQRYNHIITQQKQEVELQKIKVEEKHKEITDSINYAERIQRSFLATQQHLKDNLTEYFIMYKPKDVVSGDFYWSATLSNGHFALATADSTGHGVPGAIMSLLNITSLEKAIETYTKPSDILNCTRKIIIERLKKDGSVDGGKDGMDCSLCVYDFKNMKLNVSAANNPVWVVRSASSRYDARGGSASTRTDKESFVTSSLSSETEVKGDTDEGGVSRSEVTVIEIKADKMPVGKHDKQDIAFTEHEVELQKGDMVYTLTDGYPDQFGGSLGKKFMIKNLRELIAKNAHLPIQEQKLQLETTFEKWIGELEQIDDVCIIGIRI